MPNTCAVQLIWRSGCAQGILGNASALTAGGGVGQVPSVRAQQPPAPAGNLQAEVIGGRDVNASSSDSNSLTASQVCVCVCVCACVCVCVLCLRQYEQLP